VERIQRYRGCLLGLAAGDAVGTTLEFPLPGTFERIKDMIGGGQFELDSGIAPVISRRVMDSFGRGVCYNQNLRETLSTLRFLPLLEIVL